MVIVKIQMIGYLNKIFPKMIAKKQIDYIYNKGLYIKMEEYEGIMHWRSFD